MGGLIRLSEGEYFGSMMESRHHGLFSCSLTRYEPGATVASHYHENNYISLLVRGAYREKNRNGHSEIDAGNLIFRPGRYDHANDFNFAGGTCFNIEFKREGLEMMDYDFRLPDKMSIYPAGAFPSLYKLFHYFKSDWREELGLELILCLFSEIGQERAAPKGTLPWVAKVRAILDNEYDSHHTIGSLAARVFIHPVYLARAFREKTGTTIGEYQLQVRLRKAVFYLCNTDLSLGDIAFRTGFCDPAHFSNAFRACYCLPPKKFRSFLESCVP